MQVAARTIKSSTNDVNDLQDKVVAEVAGLLDMELEPRDRALLAAGQTTVPGTYQLNFKINGLGFQSTPFTIKPASVERK